MAAYEMDIYDFTDSDSDVENNFTGFTSADVAAAEANQRRLPLDLDSDNDVELDGESDLDISSESEMSDVEADDDIVSPQWIEKDFDPVLTPVFNEAVGPIYPGNFTASTANPLQYLQLFLDDDILNTIVRNTNKYALWKIDQEDLVQSQVWPKVLDKEELLAFIGIHILTGLNPVPSYKVLWDESPFLGNEGVKRVMSKNRFEQINRFLHVGDRQAERPSGHPDYDRLAKVRPLMTKCDRLFPRYFRPTENQTIDEGMVKCKARCSYIQYMKDKPIKRGLKLFLRNNSDTGYLQQFELYLGKRGTQAKSVHGIYFDIINRLTFRLRGKNHRVWFDNLYTSVPVALHLQRHSLQCCGTIRANRKYLPPELSNKEYNKENRGWFAVFQDKNNPSLTTCIWKDTKLVRFLSTLSQPALTTHCMRRIGGSYVRVDQPHAAHQYNKNMAGTDKFDQKRQVYPVGRSAKKMWKFLLWFFVNCCVVNAWILFQASNKQSRPKKYSQFDFRLKLVELMTATFTSRKRSVCRPIQLAAPHEEHLHVNLGLKRPRRCKMHQKFFGTKRETRYGCATCGQTLCLSCHIKVHQRQDL